MGTMANELSLGCDCLGQIHYLVLSLNTCGTTFFSQDGSIEFEIRLTGILQVYVAGPNEPAPYATRVAPGINAHFHQHLFSVRIDPMVDGLLNSVIETDVLPATAKNGSPENLAGNAFQVHDHVLSHANEGAPCTHVGRIGRPALAHREREEETPRLWTTGILDRRQGWCDSRLAVAGGLGWLSCDVCTQHVVGHTREGGRA